MDYTFTEEYELPSGGLIYEGQVNPKVTLRAMTVREEMKRQSNTSTPYKQLSEIIEACMIEKPKVHVYDMAIADYEFLLHKLRVVTYGSDYKMIVGCPHCNEISENTLNLDSLEFKKINVDEFDELLEFMITIKTKDGSKDVKIKLNYQTPRMLDEIDSRVKEYKQKHKGIDFDPTIMISLQLLIDRVDGQKLGYTAMEDFVNTLPASCLNKILSKVNKINSSFGLDPHMVTTCDKCGGEIDTMFRFGQEFFRPTED